MPSWFETYFVEHPRSLGLTYTAHAVGSLSLAFTFTTSAAKAIVHAFIPGLFVSSSTDAIEQHLPQKLSAMRKD